MVTSAPSGNRHGPDGQVLQVTLDGWLALAAVGGDSAGHAAGAAGDPRDGRHQLRAIGGGAVFHAVIQDDAVVVVGDLGFVSNSTGRPMHPLRIGRASDRAG